MRAALILVFALLSTPLRAAGDTILERIALDPAPDPDYPPAVEELTFSNGGDRLPGLLYLANGAGPHPTVVLLHGLPGNEKNLDIAQAIRRAGFNALFFHYRGAWGAEGDYRLTGLADDVAAAVSFLRDNASRYRVKADRISLLGHSMGGFAALAAGSRDPGLVCVGAMAPANLGQMAQGLRVGEPGARGFIDYADTLFMLRGFDGEAMRSDLLSAPAAELDTRLFAPGLRGKSIFMVTGDRDRVLPPAAVFDPVVEAYSADKQLQLQHHTIPGDHSFSYSRIQLTRLVSRWLLTDCS